MAATGWDVLEGRSWHGRQDDYAATFARFTALAAGPLVASTGIGPEVTALEVGAGSGVVSGLVAASGARAVVTDASSGMVALAVRAATQAAPPTESAAQTATGSATTGRCPGLVAALPRLPFAARAFDAVLGGFVLNHLGDPRAGLGELHRVCAPGGKVALTCWDRSPTEPSATGLFDEILRETGLDAAVAALPPSPFAAHAHPDGVSALFDPALWDEVLVRRLPLEQDVDADRWWTGLTRGTARLGAIVETLSRDQRRALRDAYDARVAGDRQPDGRLRVRSTALLANAVRR